MKIHQVFYLSFMFVLISCGAKEVKKEVLPEKKVETVITPVEKVEAPKPALVFTVQIGAFKKQHSKFSSLENVQVSSENNLYKYRLGAFETYNKAKSYRKTVLNKFPGAFVQAVKNNKPITIQEAIK
jgi:N-acetylmuramoyl-L-alanine amidase